MFGIRKLKREVHLLQYTTDNLINIVAGLQNCFILKGSVNIVRRGGKDCVFLEYKLKRSAIEEEMPKEGVVSSGNIVVGAICDKCGSHYIIKNNKDYDEYLRAKVASKPKTKTIKSDNKIVFGEDGRAFIVKGVTKVKPKTKAKKK